MSNLFRKDLVEPTFEGLKAISILSGGALTKTNDVKDTDEPQDQKLSMGEKWKMLSTMQDMDEQMVFHKINRKPTESTMYSHNVQVIRSAGNWSLGLKSNKVENSIQMAYLELIEKAEHFIYIENQFFISSTAGNPIRNKICEALLLRIRRAIEEDKPFKIIVVIPLLPGFQGGIDEKSGAFTRLTLHYQQMTISKGEKSLLEQ